MARTPGNRRTLSKTVALVLGVMLAIAVTVAAGAAFVFREQLQAINSWQDLQHQAIRLERLKRRLYWLNGIALPGAPDFETFKQRLAAHGLQSGAPVFIRIFKREFQLEVWLKHGDRFQLFETYPICKWSGRLGPKLRQGDRQAPEGFFTVGADAMNPASRWHRSFNLGYPNAYDRAHRRTGAYLMVHGGCSSIGCYAVTDEAMDEIRQLTTAAHKAGQSRFHVHVYPFRMTERNLSVFTNPRWQDFWRDLKNGHDAFEQTLLPPKIFVCGRRYVAVAEGNGKSAGEHRIRRACPPQRTRFVTAQSARND